MADAPMTPTTLAETILRDVKRYPHSDDADNGFCLRETEVLAALSTALDGVDERAGEVLDSLAVLADMADLFSAPLLDDDDKPEMTVALERIVAAVPALLAQNAALRAERDRYLRHLTAGADSLNTYKARAEAAETALVAERAKTAKLVEGLTGAGVPEDKLLVSRNPTRKQCIAFAEIAIRNVGYDGPWDDLIDSIALALPALSATTEESK